MAGWIIPGPMHIILALLRRGLARYIGDVKKMRDITRIITKVSKEMLLQSQHNLNLQIREFVLSCPKRIAFVRGVIGERAIRNWKIRDKNILNMPEPYPERDNAKTRKTPKTYNWKPYALPPIAILLKRSIYVFPTFPYSPAFPRPKRGFQPTIFWPHELRPNYKHIREKPEPEAAAHARKSERLCAEYYKREGGAPDQKTKPKHDPREIASAQTKPP